MDLKNLDQSMESQRITLVVNDLGSLEEERWLPLNERLHRLRFHTSNFIRD
jgi:hypothetical protein